MRLLTIFFPEKPSAISKVLPWDLKQLMVFPLKRWFKRYRPRVRFSLNPISSQSIYIRSLKCSVTQVNTGWLRISPLQCWSGEVIWISCSIKSQDRVQLSLVVGRLGRIYAKGCSLQWWFYLWHRWAKTSRTMSVALDWMRPLYMYTLRVNWTGMDVYRITLTKLLSAVLCCSKRVKAL